jgi:hypothetical protein
MILLTAFPCTILKRIKCKVGSQSLHDAGLESLDTHNHATGLKIYTCWNHCAWSETLLDHKIITPPGMYLKI